MLLIQAVLLVALYLCCYVAGVKGANLKWNIDIDHCYNFTDDLFLVAHFVRSGASMLSLVVSVPVLALRALQCYRGGEQMKHTDRLMVYACIATSLYSSAQSLQLVRVFNRADICRVVGMLVEYTSVSILVITACIGCHLIILIYQTRCLKHAPLNSTEYRRHEVVYFFLAALLPILFLPWPYLHDAYGQSGAFCWLNITDSNCKPVTGSIVQAIVLYYGWMAMSLPFTLGVILAMVVTLCLRRAQKVRCSTYAVLIYMATFFVTGMVNSVGGILLWRDLSASWYLMVQAITEPLFTISTATVILVQLCWSRCHKGSREKFMFFQDISVLEESGYAQPTVQHR